MPLTDPRRITSEINDVRERSPFLDIGKRSTIGSTIHLTVAQTYALRGQEGVEELLTNVFGFRGLAESTARAEGFDEAMVEEGDIRDWIQRALAARVIVHDHFAGYSYCEDPKLWHPPFPTGPRRN